MLSHLCGIAGRGSVASATVEVSRAIHWMDYSSLPAAQGMAKHLPLSELTGRMRAALWCPPKDGNHKRFGCTWASLITAGGPCAP